MIVGADGKVFGVASTTSERAPAPNEFTPRIKTKYSAPFVSPEIVRGDAVDAGERACQVVPPFVENS